MLFCFRFLRVVGGLPGETHQIRPPVGDYRRVLGRVKGWVLAMLASLRVAPVPLRAFDPPCAPSDGDGRSAPRNGLSVFTKE